MYLRCRSEDMEAPARQPPHTWACPTLVGDLHHAWLQISGFAGVCMGYQIALLPADAVELLGRDCTWPQDDCQAELAPHKT